MRFYKPSSELQRTAEQLLNNIKREHEWRRRYSAYMERRRSFLRLLDGTSRQVENYYQ